VLHICGKYVITGITIIYQIRLFLELSEYIALLLDFLDVIREKYMQMFVIREISEIKIPFKYVVIYSNRDI
jgi:hypothetical protein